MLNLQSDWVLIFAITRASAISIQTIQLIPTTEACNWVYSIFLDINPNTMKKELEKVSKTQFPKLLAPPLFPIPKL